MKIAYAALACLFAVSAQAAAQEKFAVEGSNIGSSKIDYRGEVVVTKTGATWQIEWRVGGAASRGTGIIMDGTHLAAAGLLDGKPFVFILKKEGNRFVGLWTTQGASEIGREVWTPK